MGFCRSLLVSTVARTNAGKLITDVAISASRAIEGPVITTTDLGSAGAVRRPAKVEGVVVNSIQTSFVGKRMMELIEAPVAFDRGARA